MARTVSRYAVADDYDGAPAPSPGPDPRRDAETLAALLAAGDDRPVVVTGGTLLTQDRQLGDIDDGDVLIRNGRISDVGRGLARRMPDAVTVDARGAIVLPGFVDSHVHAWEGQLRGAEPVLDFPGYLGFTAFGHGPRYRPHDNYVGTLATAMVALDAGVTTLVDNSHNSRTPDHSNAAVEALMDAGIRGVHAAGLPFGTELPHWPADVERLRSEYFASDDQLVTLRLFDVFPTPELWRLARDLDLWMSHEMGAHIDRVEDVLTTLREEGLLTGKHAYNHCFGLSRESWRLIAGSGGAVNVCPRSDAAFGLGPSFPPVDAIRELGLRPGLSGDNEISYGLSPFADMQALLGGHRGRTFQRMAESGPDGAPAHLSPADVLEWATLGGAANAGLEDTVGSLTPGKAADLVLVRTTDVNTAPLTDPVATVTAFAHAGNVDTVLVAGQVRKFRGELVGHDVRRVRGLVEASRDHLFAAARASDGR
ncbi:amidohydrolase family protein [Streptomyces sp. ODS05-4]|uniref:amidohydrolase family protein n=1 Tax=Streptomyces sp. ODS05-4 TaxID=2944939 RepID=UPI00210DA77E|nr:amidohydrolase family protein [Streptomyces sp. ODS05-4]